MFRLHRSSYRYQAKFPDLRPQQADQGVVDLSATLVRAAGHRVSNARVREVRRAEG